MRANRKFYTICRITAENFFVNLRIVGGHFLPYVRKERVDSRILERNALFAARRECDAFEEAEMLLQVACIRENICVRQSSATYRHQLPPKRRCEFARFVWPAVHCRVYELCILDNNALQAESQINAVLLAKTQRYSRASPLRCRDCRAASDR